MKAIDLIVPCFNEEECIDLFYQAVSDVFTKQLPNYAWRILFVDDGSSDHTLEKIKSLSETRGSNQIAYISFARNFGKEAAIYAGLENSTADYIAVMDVDLQHPPGLLPKMVKCLESGEYDCAGARRVSRCGEAPVRSMFSSLFYYVIHYITKMDFVPGMTDYRLMKRDVVDAIVSLHEHERFIKGIYAWVGFRTKWIDYENVERSVGKTKWSFKGLWGYAKSGIIAFNVEPLRGIIWLGVFVVIASLVYFFRVLYQTTNGLRKWTDSITLILLLLFFSGVIITTLGIIGEYIARVYLEVKNRPIYICRESNLQKEKVQKHG
ncbi:glycosyltransferase family 2 protein [Galactobacillus timonensis]|uniref:glycosyltransferase family 2 protein n=1 Tax=Galactobacillus timonensis TaxID=2041840 RepID=UPI000C840658|nr:glycosyltransferase family 2 protein [Galactobacillus timonensis]